MTPEPFKFGYHVSAAGKVWKSVKNALDLQCDTFQIFTTSPRGWARPSISDEDAIKFKEMAKEARLWPIVIHLPYLPNFASPEDENWEKSKAVLADELMKANQLDIDYVVIHIGSHKGKGTEYGIKRVAQALIDVLKPSDFESHRRLLLETSAGARNQVGVKFEEIGKIMELVEDERLGVCFDTCHVFAAGYDIRTPESLDRVKEELDQGIGLNKVYLVHANDSKEDLGKGKDRHWHIGEGYIGKKGWKTFLSDSYFQQLPMILETPIKEKNDDARNLAMIRQLAEEALNK